MALYIKKILGFFTVLLAIESLSFLGYVYPFANKSVFICIFLVTIFLTLKNIKFGLFIALAELIIGGKGYLFFFDIEGSPVSIRMAIWLAVMSVWSWHLIKTFIKKDSLFHKKNILSQSFLPSFIILLIIIAWGVINGVLNKNGLGNILLDANAWLYLFLVFPVYDVFWRNKNNNDKDLLKLIVLTTISIQILKTFFVEYVFSHKIYSILEPVYRWVRNTGIGEITIREDGFVRVFFQSHLYMIFAFYLLIIFSDKFFKRSRSFKIVYFAFLSLVITIILLSFSRSFWVASVAVFPLYLIFATKKNGFESTLKALGLILASSVLAFLFITATIKFPYPKPGEASFANSLSGRASELGSEAAVSSRYKLWPELIKEIKSTPILGKGFGAEVTYETSDPRALASLADGKYTTYAFEWGWLDIWLKTGVLGVIFTAFIILKIAISGLIINKKITLALSIGLIVLFVAHFFTPYINHPLGIGFIILASILINLKQKSRG